MGVIHWCTYTHIYIYLIFGNDISVIYVSVSKLRTLRHVNKQNDNSTTVLSLYRGTSNISENTKKIYLKFKILYAAGTIIVAKRLKLFFLFSLF